MLPRTDQNYYLNKDARVIGIDDTPFRRNSNYAWIIGVLMRIDGTLEKISKEKISVDGTDSTESIIKIQKRIGNGTRMILLQGITFGGFNVADIDEIYKSTGTPVAVVIDRKPNMAKIEYALLRHFKDWESRLHKMEREIFWDGLNYYQFCGIDPHLGIKFIRKLIRNGKYPEPLRLANMIASIS